MKLLATTQMWFFSKFRFSDQQKILQWKNTVKVNGFFLPVLPNFQLFKKDSHIAITAITIQ